jgi:hypothetical protein
MILPTIDKRMNACFIEPGNLYLLLNNYELVTKANQHENRLIRAHYMYLLYLRNIWYVYGSHS